ncbi:MAG: helix-turn-helix domain-containing protein [Eubacteriales bacterium]
MSNNMELAIGEKIKSLRKRREITQEQLAEYLNISFQSVSKWECGDAYPDITMLPKIALFFGVTTDELLCIDKLKEQEEAEEYIKRRNELLSIGHTKEAIVEMREANAKYPGNFKIMYELAYAIHTDVYAVPDKEYQHNAWKEIISIGEKIRTECRDDTIRQNIIEVMTPAYKCLGEKDKAIKLINENLSRLWVSRERMLELVLEGDDLIRQRQQNLLTFTELYSREMWYLSEGFVPEERLTVLENIIKIYSMIFTDGNYGYYHIKLPEFHIDAMDIYVHLGNNKKALENLKNAADHAFAFDHLKPFTPYTAPLINKTIYGNLVTSQKGNQAFNLMKRLDEERYDVIRNTPEFMEIYDNLKKYAKEDK